jgi:hypothetical protein
VRDWEEESQCWVWENKRESKSSKYQVITVVCYLQIHRSIPPKKSTMGREGWSGVGAMGHRRMLYFAISILRISLDISLRLSLS